MNIRKYVNLWHVVIFYSTFLWFVEIYWCYWESILVQQSVSWRVKRVPHAGGCLPAGCGVT